MALSIKQQRVKTRAVGRAITAGMFREFRRPGARGPHFTWGRFPRMASGIARVETFLYFPHRIGPSIKDAAARAARAEALRLTKDVV